MRRNIKVEKRILHELDGIRKLAASLPTKSKQLALINRCQKVAVYAKKAQAIIDAPTGTLFREPANPSVSKGYKKAYTRDRDAFCIVELFLPSDARICRTAGGRLRCDKAVVSTIYSPDKVHRYASASSLKDPSFRYVSGHECSSDNDLDFCRCDFCGDPAEEYRPGIYFFRTEKEAIEYDY